MGNWILLFIAIAFEVGGTTSMKLSHGFTRLMPTVFMFIFYGTGITLMNLVIRRMDLSLVYAVWSGLGTAAIALIGMIWFHEPANAIRIVSILLIILGVVGLNIKG
jgi:small multidrug resistance pump